jgi:hypothetical protein
VDYDRLEWHKAFNDLYKSLHKAQQHVLEALDATWCVTESIALEHAMLEGHFVDK